MSKSNRYFDRREERSERRRGESRRKKIAEENWKRDGDGKLCSRGRPRMTCLLGQEEMSLRPPYHLFAVVFQNRQVLWPPNSVNKTCDASTLPCPAVTAARLSCVGLGFGFLLASRSSQVDEFNYGAHGSKHRKLPVFSMGTKYVLKEKYITEYNAHFFFPFFET